MKKIAIGIFLCTFFLMRPYVLQQSGLRYANDDLDYLAHATSISFGQFPSYEKEYFTILEEGPQSSIGSGLLASPFVFAFSMIDRIHHSPIVQQRTAETLQDSWTQFGFVFASGFYFSLACFLLYKTTCLFFEKRYAALAVIVSCLVQGIPFYAFRRPIFSQLYEFFIQSLMVSIFLTIKHKGPFPHKNFKLLILVGLGAGLTYLTRYNNFFMGIAWPLLILLNEKSDFKKLIVWRNLAIIYSVFGLLVLIFKIWPAAVIDYQPYSWAADYLLAVYSPLFYLKRIWHILVFPDWGLIYTAPFIVIGLISLGTVSFPKKKIVLLSLVPLLMNLYIAIVWRTQGAFYGYRFMIASLIPSLVFPVAAFLSAAEKKYNRRLTFLWALIIFIPILSSLAYEGNYSDLDVAAIKQYFGDSDYGNNLYMMSVWKTFLFSPLEFLKIAFIGGGLYCKYLVSMGLKACGLLPNTYFTEYSVFKFSTLIRTLLLYCIPFALYQIFQIRGHNHES